VKLQRIGIILCLTVSLMPAILQADSRELNRRDFGQNALPLWAPLSGFEVQTINNFALAQAGDPEALLALYLLASGDVRSTTDFSRYQQRLQQGISRLQLPNPRAGNARSLRRLAESLHHGLHNEFHAGPGALDGGNYLAGYDAEQSQLSRLFDSGIFNCISSALLYAVAAREFDLQVDGVLLPSHALIQLTLPDGEVVNIETTASDGFDMAHDEAYFSRNIQWFEQRDLAAPDQQAQPERKVVSLADLGLENMWNQHAASGRMAYPDRLRLAEIRGYLMPHDPQAQKNRMLYYTREFETLSHQGDDASLLRLFTLIDDYIESLGELAQHPEAVEDNAFLSLLAWLQAAHANALVLGPEPGRGRDQIRTLLAALDRDWQDIEAIRHNLFVGLARYTERRLSSQAFPQARQAFDGIEVDCAAYHPCRDALTRVYAEWASFYWQLQDWHQVTNTYHDFFELALDSTQSSLMAQNLETAYHNWADQQWLDEDRDGAIERLEQCLEVLPDAALCSRRHAEMTRLHQGW